MRRPLSYVLTLLVGVSLGSATVAASEPAADPSLRRIESRVNGLAMDVRFLRQAVGNPLVDQPQSVSGDLQNLQSNDSATSMKLRAICAALRTTC